jgi:xanthine dehydrogenase accessory factor
VTTSVAATEVIGLAEVARAALEAAQGGEAVAAVAVVEARTAAGEPEPIWIGRRMLVWAGRTVGSLDAPDLDARAIELARGQLQDSSAPRSVEVATERGVRALYIETFGPPPELVIVGAGHIARPLSRLGAMLGFRVCVLDDRPAFATHERFPEADRLLRVDFADPFRAVPLDRTTHLVLVTRGHRYDYDALRDVLRRPIEPAYIGMVGSRRRVRAALQELAREGIPPERLRRIHAPIGLDIGAETPEEIAVAIAAEIIRLRRGGTGVSLRDRERVAERWIRGENDE